MTLDELIAGGGFFSSFLLLTVLGLMWPTRLPRCVLCFKQRQDEHCAPACLRTCRVMRNAAAAAKVMLGVQLTLDRILDVLLAGSSAFAT